MSNSTTTYEWDTPNELRLTSRPVIESLLIDVWQDRLFPYASSINQEESEDEGRKNDYQPFLEFDGNKFKARNYVGFVQCGNELIEIYPKVFKNTHPNDKKMMLEHLFYWFRYCRKLAVPFTESRLDTRFCDSFPELLIFLFAHYCHEIISTQPYSCYVSKEEVLLSPKGRIDFHSYLQHGLAHGNNHEIDCVYEPFEYDNDLNRGIKTVSRRLTYQSRFYETRQLLEQIGFILDEVDEELFLASSLDRVSLNPVFASYDPILEWTRRFLRHQLYSHEDYASTQWSLLLPMEYVFEDFVAGFLEQHFHKEFTVEYQKSNLYLSSNPRAFNLQHDILITRGSSSLIIDTKYKLRDTVSPSDPKKGISSADMYQMVSYAFRRGCDKVLLLFPTRMEKEAEMFQFSIQSDFVGAPGIHVWGAEIPFWNIAGISELDQKLTDRFQDIFAELKI